MLTDVGAHMALRRIAATLTNTALATREQGIMFCLSDVATWIHADNRKRGWWSNLHTGEPLDRNVGELLMLMVSEIAEIPDGATGHPLEDMDDKLLNRLMFEVELADCAIRIFDTAGALAPKMYTGFCDAARVTDKPMFQEIDTLLLRVVRCLALAMEGHRKGEMMPSIVPGQSIPAFDYRLGRAIHQIFLIGSLYGLHIADAIMEKLRFNAQREDHKVEHRRAAGGKVY